MCLLLPICASEHCGLSVCEAYCTQHLEPHALCHHHHPEGVPSPGQTMEVTTLDDIAMQCYIIVYGIRMRTRARVQQHAYTSAHTHTCSRACNTLQGINVETGPALEPRPPQVCVHDKSMQIQCRFIRAHQACSGSAMHCQYGISTITDSRHCF